ncbi:hypothetical protein GMI70_06915 [Eggerthellaceae bacterium zg-893]|nr:hypothetical protein [Eggerthellaceae bacterium zg-893]
MDLLQVMADALEGAGIENVFPARPDGRAHPERTVLAFGAPGRRTGYYDGDDITPLRVTCVAVRVAEGDAMAAAQACEHTLRRADLASRDGSYRLVSAETTAPRPLPWDESGRFAWAFDTEIEIISNRF